MKSFVAILAFVALAAADVSHLVRGADFDAQIVSQDADVLPDKFNFVYETSNGIKGQAAGVLKNVGKENEGIEVQGANSYVGPDGLTYSVSYTADENGYQPTGDHLPVPPAIPEYILRSLEFIASHPPAQEQKRF